MRIIIVLLAQVSYALTERNTIETAISWILCQGDDNQFHTIGQCPQTPYTGFDTPHNPYRMQYDDQDHLPAGKSAASSSTLGNTDIASADPNQNLGADQNLTPADNSWEPVAFVDNAKPGADQTLTPADNSWEPVALVDNAKPGVDSNLIPALDSELALRRNRKNRRKAYEEV